MAQEAIIEKLNEFIKGHNPLSEECHAVYFMVEVRKILDHDRKAGAGAFPLLRFYCDWMVHTEKTLITPEMKKVVSDIFQHLNLEIENPSMRSSGSPSSRFVYMIRGQV